MFRTNTCMHNAYFFLRHSVALKGVKRFRNANEPNHHDDLHAFSSRVVNALHFCPWHSAKRDENRIRFSWNFISFILFSFLSFFPHFLPKHVKVYETHTQSPTQTQKIDERTFSRASQTRMWHHSSINPSKISSR